MLLQPPIFTKLVVLVLLLLFLLLLLLLEIFILPDLLVITAKDTIALSTTNKTNQLASAIVVCHISSGHKHRNPQVQVLHVGKLHNVRAIPSNNKQDNL